MQRSRVDCKPLASDDDRMKCVLQCWATFRNLLIKEMKRTCIVVLNRIVQKFTIKSETTYQYISRVSVYFCITYWDYNRDRSIKIIIIHVLTMKTEPGIANVCLQIQALQNNTSTYRKCSSLYIINRSETDLMSSNDVGNFSSPLLRIKKIMP